MKRLTMALILVVLLISVCVTVSATETSGTCGANLVWKFDKASGTLTISGTGPMDDWAQGAEPGWAEWGSWYNPLIKHIVIGEGVTTIGIEAFAYSSVQTVSFPSTLTNIGSDAFLSCSEIREIDFPENLISIGKGAFMACSNISQLQLPGSLKTLEYNAFGNIYSLEKVKIGPNLKEFSMGVFWGCSNLSLIEFTGNAPVFHASALNDTDATVIYPAGNSTWTENVRQQYGGTVYWHPSNNLTASGTLSNGAFSWNVKNGTLTISGNGYINGWNGTETAPWYPLRGVIEKVVMTGTITNIPGEAFEKCSNLKNVSFPNGLQVILGGAFQGCTSLETVTLPDTVTSIGENTFQDCISLKKVTMSKALKNIGQWAFFGCNSLEEMHFTGSVPTNYGEAKASGNLTVYYPAGNSLWNEANMKEFKKGFHENTKFVGVGEPFVPSSGVGGTTMGGFTWSLKDGVLTVSGNGMMKFDPMPSWGGKELAPWFEHRLDVKEVVVKSGVTGLDPRAFQQCDNLKKVTLPNTLQNISEQMFHGCDSLASIEIPDSVTTIDTAAFLSCVSLKKITIPGSVTLIKVEAFAGCTALEEVSIMGSPEFSTCFQGCKALKTLKFYGDVPSLGGTCLEGVTATAYYPAGNITWTKDRLTNYGGTLTWKPFGCTKHSEVQDAAVAAGCLTAGKTAGAHCSKCGVVTKPQQAIPAKGHSFGDWKQTKAPTTQAAGQETRSCKNCNAVEQREIPKLTQQTQNPTQPKPTEPDVTVPPTVLDPTEPEGTESQPPQPEGTTATDPNEEPTQPAQPEPPKSTPWIAIAVAGGMIVAGGGAAAWYFVLRKRK